jgi:hypothetical protein
MAIGQRDSSGNLLGRGPILAVTGNEAHDSELD